ncbi:serine acetyltransferase [Flavobacterium alvei]|jgi:serine O-acetyltransferase|uniref:Serine acetyltransferase n=1 Tax=Flavobacterium alvei TaxID=2080416 RepID=A0A2S5A758_9FLAO|nr:serine acetyltransferase [Flavobacterium alvei]POY38117.1 serine acetyltransferase [Flavobacterium alvei]
MIDSIEKYNYYLQEDRKALGITKNTFLMFLNPFEIDFEIYKFQRALRKCEYLYNSKNSSFFWKVRKFIAATRFKRLSCKLGFTINPNCFGPGLRIAHRGTIVVNGGCVIGANCTINACVNIGANPGSPELVPQIGDNVYIGPGAKLFGGIFIANGCTIGANAVVNKSCNVINTVLVGVPAMEKGVKLF